MGTKTHKSSPPVTLRPLACCICLETHPDAVDHPPPLLLLPNQLQPIHSRFHSPISRSTIFTRSLSTDRPTATYFDPVLISKPRSTGRAVEPPRDSQNGVGPEVQEGFTAVIQCVRTFVTYLRRHLAPTFLCCFRGTRS